MPEVSTFVRRPADEDTGVEAATTIGIPSRELDSGLALARLRERPDIFSVFSLTASFNLPMCDLPAVKGIPTEGNEADRRSYGLGAGVSCTVVVHQTGKEEKEVHEPGTLVALKRYSITPDSLPTGGQANRKLCQLLWQELTVFTHSYLRGHENICKLLFVGWDGNSTVPSLALELAQYGTLDDCLQHLRSYDSALRKTHLSCDIALGLAALHACGFVHGDIKPSNIILQSHPSRAVVAKLSDFNGVCPKESYGSNPYSFGTPEWQAPEAIMLEEENIDWQLCDVYSAVMVMATIWKQTGYIPLGGSFLDTFLQYKLNQDERRVWIQIHKLLPDDSETGMMQMALSGLANPSNSPFHLRRIVAKGLSAMPANRSSMASIVDIEFARFARETNRDIRFVPPATEPLQSKTYNEATFVQEIFVLKPAFIKRSADFKKTMFSSLLAAGNELRSSVNLPVVFEIEESLKKTDNGLTDSGLLDFIALQKRRLVSALIADERLHRFNYIAANIALSYLLGIGTSVEECFGLEWLVLAARAGETNSIHLFSTLEQSMDQPPHKVPIPRRLWCAIGTMSGYAQTAASLRAADPDLADLATRIYRRLFWGRPEPQILSIEPYLPDWIVKVRENNVLVDSEVPSREGHTSIQETALHICAATGDMESARYLVTEAHANINATNARNETPIFYATRAGQFEIAKFLYEHKAEVTHISTEGYSITHCLSMMDDEHGAELAPLYVSSGARLDVVAQEYPRAHRDNFCCGMGLPLFWAALKLRPLLFVRLLKLHTTLEHRVLSRADLAQLLGMLSKLHLYEMLGATLCHAGRIVDPGRSSLHITGVDPRVQRWLQGFRIGADELDTDTDAPEITSWLLYEAMNHWPLTVLQRRYILREKFLLDKENTIALLLKRGVNPFAPNVVVQAGSFEQEKTIPLTVAIYTRDTVAFRLFLRHGRDLGIDLLPVLADPRRYGGYSALQRSIYSDARDIFFLLLAEFPSLVDEVGEHGYRPLHSAAVQEWPGYVRELLRGCVNPHDRSRDCLTTPFLLALLWNRNLDVVKALADGYDGMSVLQHPDADSVFTYFGILLRALVASPVAYGVERLRYFVERFGAPDFFIRMDANGRHDDVFKIVLAQNTRPTDRAQLAYEASILEFLLHLFPDKVDFVDFSGLAPLHHAVFRGNHAAVEALLRCGATVRLPAQPAHESSESSQSRTFTGFTALDIAVTCHRIGPRHVLRGGQRDLHQWECSMQDIIRSLKAAEDGKSGAGEALHDGLLTDIAADRLQDIPVGVSGVQRLIKMGDGDWPHRLPPDGPRPAPFQVEGYNDEENASVEVIGSSGLFSLMPRGTLTDMQELMGADSPQFWAGNLVKELPPPPKEYLATLQDELSNRRADRSRMYATALPFR